MGEKLEITSKVYLSPFGITRAEQRLYLTSASSRTIFGRSSYNSISRFINEISDGIVEHTSKSGGYTHTEELPFRTNRYDRAPQYRAAQKSTSRITHQQATGGDQHGWKAGDKAVHGKWGTGTVVSVKGAGENTELDIAFPQIGIKRLLAKFAPITKA